MGEDKWKTSMKGKDKKKRWAKMDGWNAQEKNGERDETKREKIFYLKAFLFWNEKIQPIKLPYLCHVIQNAIATQEFDNRTKTRKCRKLIGQF